MSSGFGLEPYNGRALAKLLEHVGGAEVRSNGRAVRQFRMPNGTEIPCPLDNDPVASTIARRAADLLGKTWHEFRAAVGHPLVASGRPRGTTRRTATGCTKREVLHRIAETRRVLAEVERAIRPGLRDSSFYLRVHERLAETQRQAERAVSEATSTGADVSVGRTA